EHGLRFEYETDVAMQAVRVAGGWQLQGAKQLVIHGGAADVWLVSARLEDSPGFGIFVVPKDQPGVEMRGYRLVDGTCACDLTFSAVVVAEDALLLDGSVAPEALEEALDRSVVVSSAVVIGSME